MKRAIVWSILLLLLSICLASCHASGGQLTGTLGAPDTDGGTTPVEDTTSAPQTTKAPATTTVPETTKTPTTTQKPDTTKAPETTQKPDVSVFPNPASAPVTVTVPAPPTELSKRDPAIEAKRQAYPQRNNIPTLYVMLNDGKTIEDIESNKDVYVPATFSLVSGNDKYDIFEQPISMKGRGNWSWKQEQKPYALKLDSKMSLLGMGSAKKWVLIANYSDKTLLRNYMTLNLAATMGMRGSTECYHVDLVVNGEYRGNYLLTEKVEIHNDRLDLPKESGILMEIEVAKRHEYQCDFCIETPEGVHILMKEFQGTDAEEIMTKQDLKTLSDLVTRAERSMSEGYAKYSQYIDVGTFVDWFIVNEFAKNLDSQFTTSCYTYINEEGKLCMGPCWDYDTCFGNQKSSSCFEPEGYHVGRSARWFKLLLKDSDFKKRVKERWTDLRNSGVLDDFYNSIDPLVAYLAESEQDTHERWPGALRATSLRKDESLFTYKEEVAYYKNWIRKRVAWFDSEFYVSK